MIRNYDAEPANLHILPPLAIEQSPDSFFKDDFEDFTIWLKDKLPPEIIRKIFENLHFISEESLQTALDSIAQQIDEFVGDEPYYFHIAFMDKSESFMLDLIWPKLKNKPKGIITNSSVQDGNTLTDYIVSKVPAGAKIVHINDLAASGLQDLSRIKEARNGLGVTTSWGVFFVGMTEDAKDRISGLDCVQHISSYYMVPKLKDIFTTEELDKIRSLTDLTEQFGKVEDCILTYSYFKVPDNIPTFFRMRRSRNNPYLLRDVRGGLYMEKYPQEVFEKIRKRAKFRLGFLRRFFSPY